MPHNPELSPAEVVRIGEAIYEEKLRDKVETEQNIGKQIVIDIETGEYEIDRDGLAASHRLLDKHPGAVLYGGRIGYTTVYAVGGSLKRKIRS